MVTDTYRNLLKKISDGRAAYDEADVLFGQPEKPEEPSFWEQLFSPGSAKVQAWWRKQEWLPPGVSEVVTAGEPGRPVKPLPEPIAERQITISPTPPPRNIWFLGKETSIPDYIDRMRQTPMPGWLNKLIPQWGEGFIPKVGVQVPSRSVGMAVGALGEMAVMFAPMPFRWLKATEFLNGMKVTERVALAEAAGLPGRVGSKAIEKLTQEELSAMASVLEKQGKLVLPKVTPAAAQAAKEPWQMTGEEYNSYVNQLRKAQEKGLSETLTTKMARASDELSRIQGGRSHKWQVEKALSEGKLVPPEVLKDYPDLAKAIPKTIPEAGISRIWERTPTEIKVMKPLTKEAWQKLTPFEKGEAFRVRMAVPPKGKQAIWETIPENIRLSLQQAAKTTEELRFELQRAGAIPRAEAGIGKIPEVTIPEAAIEGRGPYARFLQDIGDTVSNKANFTARGVLKPQAKTQLVNDVMDALDRKIINRNEAGNLLAEYVNHPLLDQGRYEDFINLWKGKPKVGIQVVAKEAQPMAEEELASFFGKKPITPIPEAKPPVAGVPLVKEVPPAVTEAAVPPTVPPVAKVRPPTTHPEVISQLRQFHTDIGDDIGAWKVSLKGLKGPDATKARLVIKSLEKEVQNLDETLKVAGAKIAPADIRAKRQQINAIASYKGFTEKQLRDIYEKATGSRYLTKMTDSQLDTASVAVQNARPKKIGNKIVISEKTESKISELKTNLVQQGKLDDDTFRATVRYLRLPTAGYKSKNLFISESEGRNLIRSLNRQAEVGLIEWDTTVNKALSTNPALKGAIEDITGRFIKPMPSGKLVGVSPFWDMEKYTQKLQERTGKRFYDVFVRLADRYQSQLARIDDTDRALMASSSEFRNIAKDEAALKRITDYISAKNKYLVSQTGIKSPPNISGEEIKVANWIEKELFAYQPDVRFSRFYKAYSEFGDDINRIVQEIPNAPKADVRQAVDIYESKGVDALYNFLKTKDWGVIKSGYEPHIVINPKLQLTRIKSTVVGKGRLQTREGVDFNPLDRTILDRRSSYIRQMETLKLEPYFREMDRLYQESVPALKDAGAVNNALSTMIDEMKGFRIRSVATQLAMKVGSYAFSVLAIAPRMTVRNMFQNPAMHADFFRFLNPTNRKLTEIEMNYLKTYVAQESGILRDWMMQEAIGTSRLAQVVKRLSYFGKGETYLNRIPSMWASINKAEDALNVFKKSGNIRDFITKSGLQDLTVLEQKRILELVSLPQTTIEGIGKVTGEQAAIMELGKRQTIAAHFNYIRALQAPALQGEAGRLLGSLGTYPRGVLQKTYIALSKIKSGNASEKGRAVKVLTSMVAGSLVANFVLRKALGTEYNIYNPLNVLQWQPGGLAVGAPQDVAQTVGDMMSVAMGDENAKDRVIKGIARSGDMFLPLYSSTMNIIESLTDTRYLDRQGLRWLRSQIEKDYKPRESYYKANRNWVEKLQHALFGSVNPEEKIPTIPSFTPLGGEKLRRKKPIFP